MKGSVTQHQRQVTLDLWNLSSGRWLKLPHVPSPPHWTMAVGWSSHANSQQDSKAWVGLGLYWEQQTQGSAVFTSSYARQVVPHGVPPTGQHIQQNTLLLLIHHYYFFWLSHRTCGIFLTPDQRLEPGPLAVRDQSPNHWIAREVPQTLDFKQNKHWVPDSAGTKMTRCCVCPVSGKNLSVNSQSGHGHCGLAGTVGTRGSELSWPWPARSQRNFRAETPAPSWRTGKTGARSLW